MSTRTNDGSRARRETHAARLARAGHSNKVIAIELGVSEATVSRMLRGRERASAAQIARGAARAAQLSAAERAVAALAARGRTNRAIAAARSTSPRTIANQLASVYGKLRVSSRRGLRVALAALGAAGPERKK